MTVLQYHSVLIVGKSESEGVYDPVKNINNDLHLLQFRSVLIVDQVEK